MSQFDFFYNYFVTNWVFAMDLAIGWRASPWCHNSGRDWLIISQTDKNKHACHIVYNCKHTKRSDSRQEQTYCQDIEQFVSVIVNIEDLVGDGSVTYWPLFCFDLIIFVVLVLKCWSCALDNSQYKETRRGRPRW